MSRWLSLSVVAVCCFSFTSTVVAQEDATIEIYGQGLHRYFAGDYREAEKLLGLVVDSGTQDPRAHYFRGLAQYMQGRSVEAKYDFETGAKAEARGKRVVPVGMSLQRIQGPVRMEIEKARQAARVAVIIEQAQQRRMRADTARAQGAVMQAPATMQPAAPAPIPPATSDSTDPFAGTSRLQAGKPLADEAKPAAPTGDAAINPFGDDPVPGAAAMPAPAANDPFSTPATPATPAESPAADPFSAPAAPSTPTEPPAADDPFSTPAAEPPTAGAGDANPFGA